MHPCPASACRERIPAKLYMCRTHWLMLPYWLRHLLNRHYQPGQEPTAEMRRASRTALALIAEKEERMVPGDA